MCVMPSARWDSKPARLVRTNGVAPKPFDGVEVAGDSRRCGGLAAAFFDERGDESNGDGAELPGVGVEVAGTPDHGCAFSPGAKKGSFPTRVDGRLGGLHSIGQKTVHLSVARKILDIYAVVIGGAC